MRKVISFLTEKKEEECITVAREAYYQSLLVLCSVKKLSPTEIKLHYLRDLLLETLNQLVHYFEKNQDRITQEGDQKTLDDLASQLNLKISAPNVVQTLKTNLYQIKPGWVNRGFVYQVFAMILSLPIFQSECLWRSEVNRVSVLETDVDRLEKKTEVLSFGERRIAAVSSQHDYQALQSAKNILFADSFKVQSAHVKKEDKEQDEIRSNPVLGKSSSMRESTGTETLLPFKLEFRS